MSEPKPKANPVETFDRMVATWLRFGDAQHNRSRRAEFVRALDPNASTLALTLAVTYERARRLQQGALPNEKEAAALAHLMRARQRTISDAAAALEPDAALGSEAAALSASAK